MTLPLADDRQALLDDIAYCDRALRDSLNAELDGRQADRSEALAKRERLRLAKRDLELALAEQDGAE